MFEVRTRRPIRKTGPAVGTASTTKVVATNLPPGFKIRQISATYRSSKNPIMLGPI